MRNLFVTLFLVFILSCNSKSEPENISDKFVNFYYREMNQNKAIELSIMTAKDKLEKEIQLLKSRNNQFINEVPKVSLIKEDIQIKDDIALITYKLIIQPKNVKTFEKKAFISLYKENNTWKVSNFEEMN
jgi:hypothetical protein